MSAPHRLEWVSQSGGAYPPYAVHAGVDSDNELYVARAHHEGAIVPGKLHVTHSSIYIAYNMAEVPVGDYEVLIAPPASLSWVEGSGGNTPTNAVEGGHENDGEKLFIGRVIHEGTVTVGKVHPSHGVCYFPYAGEELNSADYEILVRNAFGLLKGV